MPGQRTVVWRTIALAIVVAAVVGCEDPNPPLSAIPPPIEPRRSDDDLLKPLEKGAPASRPAAPSTVAPTPPPVAWQKIESPEHGISFEMPGPPAVAKNEENDTLAGRERWTRYAFRSPDFAEYAVQLTPLTAQAADRVETVLDGVRDALVAGDRGKLLDERPLMLAGHPGRAITFEVVAARVRVVARVYIVGDTLCQMMVGVPLDRPLPEGATRFFDSLKLPDRPGTTP